MCMAPKDPVEVLLRKQPPTPTNSFFMRMKFLIEDKSVQNYAKKDEYSERRVSVVRGRVLNSQGLGIIGVRVSVDGDTRFGFTLSRQGGWYDMLLNGGGSIRFQFQRSFFRPASLTVSVPWNQIIVVPPLTMHLDSEEPPGKKGTSNQSQISCGEHDLNPVIRSGWGASRLVGGEAERSVVWQESRVLQESIRIPGTHLHLLYQSHLADGYLSTLWMQLTFDPVPEKLTAVHLKLTLRGKVTERTFEPEPNITYTYVWDKRNIYQQKVYGWATAKVAVGYQYSDCDGIVWVVQAAELQGFQMEISDVGGWNLHIHHGYNFQDGYLQKGDGRTMLMRDLRKIMKPVLGTGVQRPLDCRVQSGICLQGLLSPSSLAAGPDGSLYVGDFNLIKRIPPEEEEHASPTILLALSESRKTYEYYMAVSPVDGHLYLSDPERFRIYRISIDLGRGRDRGQGEETPVVGSGQRCLPGDKSGCGDGSSSLNAKLTYPKGITFAADGTMYFVDGSSIRMVDSSGKISTWFSQTNQQMECQGSGKMGMQWPTKLEMNPVDESLYFVDDQAVFQLSPQRRLRLLVGQPLHCQSVQGHPSKEGTGMKNLGVVKTLAIDPHGRIHVGGVSSDGIPYVKQLKPGSGEITITDSAKGNEGTPTLTGVSDLVVSPDGRLWVADSAAFHVFLLETHMPKADNSGNFWIPYLPSREIYIFDKNGHHIATKDLVTGKELYSFQYNVKSSFGKLIQVTDASGNKVSFFRDYRLEVNTIELTDGRKYNVGVSRLGLMEKLLLSPNRELEFRYGEGESGLLVSRMESPGGTPLFIYDYDETGRVAAVTSSTGRRTTFASHSRLDLEDPPRVTASISGLHHTTTFLLNGDSALEYTAGPRSGVITMLGEGGNALVSPDMELLYGDEKGNPVLRALFPLDSQVFSSPTSELTRFGGISNPMTMEWHVQLTPDQAILSVDRELKVNGTKVLTLSYDLKNSVEVIWDASGVPIGGAQLNASGRAMEWIPRGIPVSDRGRGTSRVPLLFYHDSLGRFTGWQWGTRGRRFNRDQGGRVREVVGPDGNAKHFDYEPTGKEPVTLTLASGRAYTYKYDSSGGLESITTPQGLKHEFLLESLFEFHKYRYTPPGYKAPYLIYLDDSGKLLQVSLPGDSGGKVLYVYGEGSELSEVVHGGGKTSFLYHGAVVRKIQAEERFFQCQYMRRLEGPLIREEKLDYDARSGLADAKFFYDYDENFRITSISGRIGGNRIPAFHYQYSSVTGGESRIGDFTVIRGEWNETTITDGETTFIRTYDTYSREIGFRISVHGQTVYRRDTSYDVMERISEIREETTGMTRTSMTRTFAYDADGQVIKADAQEPWSFSYDSDGNLVSLSLRDTDVEMKNEQGRLVAFGQGRYKYDSRGFVVENAAGDGFVYDGRGCLVRALKQGRFHVHYEYDHFLRLVMRKDSYGNVTQFFYADPSPSRRNRVTHVFSTRENRVTSLTYDPEGKVIMMEDGVKRLYVATDACGTPVKMWNSRGEVVREIIRGPYGKIMWDSNPHLYIPVDFCGGILETLTESVHMSQGRVYDPVVGQWMTPNFRDIPRRIPHPRFLHLYRFNGNDPVNYGRDTDLPHDHLSWMTRLGYDVPRIIPQLSLSPPTPDPSRILISHLPPHTFPALNFLRLPTVGITWGLQAKFQENLLKPEDLPAFPRSVISPSSNPSPVSEWELRVSRSPSPLGEGITLSREGSRCIVRSVGGANEIYRDVFTSLLNRSHFLDVHFVEEGAEVFYFVKRDPGDIEEDRKQLRRLSSVTVNASVTNPRDSGSAEGIRELSAKSRGVVFRIRYGEDPDHFRHKILKGHKRHLSKSSWEEEKRLLSLGIPAGWGSPGPGWTDEDVQEILRLGFASDYDFGYRWGPVQYPQLADDSFNVQFQRRRGRRE
ncbi:unnamed protein product [Darwinula stevensoni]|uniref:Uncharacterized protein n=1 Tax=Darwinula stevensoni TaxID=69355 RepID=A0A7R8X4B9_9CRUS|nr:unnamed protein product [Darwinula stevensoni]CAG0878874.1 unnamed protein product [Darwinula stevensoni]